MIWDQQPFSERNEGERERESQKCVSVRECVEKVFLNGW